MAGIKKLAGAYLVLVAVVVAVFFIVNNFLVNAMDVLTTWLALDVLMLVGLAVALIYNYARKKEADGGNSDDGVTRGYFEANVCLLCDRRRHYPLPAQLVCPCWPTEPTILATATISTTSLG